MFYQKECNLPCKPNSDGTNDALARTHWLRSEICRLIWLLEEYGADNFYQANKDEIEDIFKALRNEMEG